MQAAELFASVFVLVVLSGVFIVVMGLRQRTQQLEMQHRERMAMIERGLAPFDERRPPPGMGAVSAAGFRRGPTSRTTPLGIVVVAVGLGLMSIVSIAGGSPEVGVGLGGAIVVVGAAFIAIGMLARAQSSDVTPPPLPPEPRDPAM
jgi:hypothetical protein